MLCENNAEFREFFFCFQGEGSDDGGVGKNENSIKRVMWKCTATKLMSVCKVGECLIDFFSRSLVSITASTIVSSEVKCYQQLNFRADELRQFIISISFSRTHLLLFPKLNS